MKPWTIIGGQSSPQPLPHKNPNKYLPVLKTDK